MYLFDFRDEQVAVAATDAIKNLACSQLGIVSLPLYMIFNQIHILLLLFTTICRKSYSQLHLMKLQILQI